MGLIELKDFKPLLHFFQSVSYVLQRCVSVMMNEWNAQTKSKTH